MSTGTEHMIYHILAPMLCPFSGISISNDNYESFSLYFSRTLGPLKLFFSNDDDRRCNGCNVVCNIFLTWGVIILRN